MTANNTSLRASSSLAALFLAVSLVGCGGGGSSPAPATSPPTAPNPPPPAPAPVDVISSSGNLQTTAVASTYGAGSVGDNFYTALNTARASAGAGVLNQSAALDTAAQAHALYETTNLATEGIAHVEVATSPNFYATTWDARETKAGYAPSLGTEVIGGAGTGDNFAYGLLATAYHGAALLSDSTDVGFGSSADQFDTVGVSDLGAPASKPYGQVAASGNLIAYPYSNQTGVLGTFYVSGEIPRVSTTLLPNATAGAPVIVNIQNADYVNLAAKGAVAPVVTSFTLTDSSGTAVPAVIIANSAITGASGVAVNSDAGLGVGFVELIATTPLTSGMTYTAAFTATLKTGGTPLNKTWSFLVQ
jgi:hypothetical protein